jgi:hypothetical protein
VPWNYFPDNEDDLDDGRVFSNDAYDLLIYTGKTVIWLWPDLEIIPIDLVETQDAEDFYKLLKKYQIRYILTDRRYIIRSDSFRGRSYPEYFYNKCVTISLS